MSNCGTDEVKKVSSETLMAQWRSGADSMKRQGFCVTTFIPSDSIRDARTSFAQELMGVEFNKGTTITSAKMTLHPTGACAHPSSFHGQHRILNARYRELVAFPLFAAMEDSTVGRKQPRFIEMLPSQVFVKTEVASTPRDRRWFYESTPAAALGDDIFTGFINYNKNAVIMEVVPGTHNFSNTWKNTRRGNEITEQQNENSHKIYLRGNEADSMQKFHVRVKVNPGDALLYNTKLVVRQRFSMTNELSKSGEEFSLLSGLAFRLTCCHNPLYPSIIKSLQTQGVPRLFSGFVPGTGIRDKNSGFIDKCLDGSNVMRSLQDYGLTQVLPYTLQEIEAFLPCVLPALIMRYGYIPDRQERCVSIFDPVEGEEEMRMTLEFLHEELKGSMDVTVDDGERDGFLNDGKTVL